jgi:hypothetical protein
MKGSKVVGSSTGWRENVAAVGDPETITTIIEQEKGGEFDPRLLVNAEQAYERGLLCRGQGND